MMVRLLSDSTIWQITAEEIAGSASCRKVILEDAMLKGLEAVDIVA